MQTMCMPRQQEMKKKIVCMPSVRPEVVPFGCEAASVKTRRRHLLEMAPPRRVIFSTRSICHDASSRDHGGTIWGTICGTLGKIRLTQFMPKVWEKLQTCVQDRRDMKLGRKKSEPWLGKGVVNNPSKAWDIWYAVQCKRSNSGNQLGWRESSMGRCWRCRF